MATIPDDVVEALCQELGAQNDPRPALQRFTERTGWRLVPRHATADMTIGIAYTYGHSPLAGAAANQAAAMRAGEAWADGWDSAPKP